MLESLLKSAENIFEKKYNCKPTIAVVSPGRVNLIGEHTDYNEGFVFPMALPLQTIIVGRKNPSSDSKCRITTTSEKIDEPHSIEFELPKTDLPLTPSLPKWCNYIKGVIANHPNQYNLPAFDAVIASDIPVGGGLSSSAALEAATCKLINALVPTKEIQMSLDSMAKLCQKAEHVFAGVPCGIMDQFICLGAQEGTAMLLDCRSLKTELIPLVDITISFLVIDSNVKHNLGSSEYPIRHEQCMKAAQLLNKKSLREANLQDLKDNKHLFDDTCYKRAKHVITEIDRCVKGAEALKDKDYICFGQLMLESHYSLRDDYEVSCKELDQLVEIVMQIEDVFGCRMTGGGFGGCVVLLLNAKSIETTIQLVKTKYQESAAFYPCTPSAGARVLYNHEIC